MLTITQVVNINSVGDNLIIQSTLPA